VLGTVHVSSKSVEDVERVIEAVQPDAVVVELCRSRSIRLYLDKVPSAQAKKAANPMVMSGMRPWRPCSRELRLRELPALLPHTFSHTAVNVY
jgi:hypothetical protein